MRKKPDNSNTPIFPSAQECYEASVSLLTDVDTTEAMDALAIRVKDAVTIGAFAAFLNPIDGLIAEKMALQLEALGYHVGVFNSNQGIPTGDGTFKPGAMIQVNWKMMPPNTRDSHTV